MFNQVIEQCLKNYPNLPCCHNDGRYCNCYDCLKRGFFGGLDEYECPKELNYYVLKYGPSFISEIYYYLSASLILEHFQGNGINVLSLGCGFSPDYYAILKYISDHKLPLRFNYYGWDISTIWQSTRLTKPNLIYQTVDLLNPFPFENCHIIMLNKIFSTICRQKNQSVFLANIVDAIENTMPKGAVLIFNDVNHFDKGRDLFDNKISPFFDPAKIRRYYTDDPDHPACRGYGTWHQIPQNQMIYPTDYAPDIGPLDIFAQNVFFEYWKKDDN